MAQADSSKDTYIKYKAAGSDDKRIHAIQIFHWAKNTMEYYDTGERNPAKVASTVLKFKQDLSK